MLELMRASVLVDVGKIEVRDVPRPSPGPRDVLVQPAAVGMCGTDFHIYGGEFNFHLDPRGVPVPLREEPQILGHEICGVVREVGREVADLAPGDRVVLDQGINCNSTARAELCEYCASGDSHQCAFYAEHGITGLQGGFAEYIAIPALNCVRIESELDFAHAALTEPLGCVLHSTEMATRANTRYSFAHADPARRVRSALILGAGPAGLLFLQVMRRVIGFDGLILLTDRNANKRALAEKLGAVAIDPSCADLTDAVLEHTGGRRVEYLVEATGSGPIFETIPSLIRKQATVQMYGVGHGGASLEAMNQVQWKEPSLILSVGASGGFDPDGRPAIYRKALSALERGTVDVTEIVSHRYQGLDSLASAFAGDHERQDYVKGVALLS